MKPTQAQIDSATIVSFIEESQGEIYLFESCEDAKAYIKYENKTPGGKGNFKLADIRQFEIETKAAMMVPAPVFRRFFLHAHEWSITRLEEELAEFFSTWSFPAKVKKQPVWHM